MLSACRGTIALLAFFALAASGSAQQSQQVFPLPEGAYPHDVAPAQDDKVWYSAQRNGALGILDPSTGQSREIRFWRADLWLRGSHGAHSASECLVPSSSQT
jgi:virginiamycin B lyase